MNSSPVGGLSFVFRCLGLGAAVAAAAVAAPRVADAALTLDPPIVTGSGGFSVVGTPTISVSGSGTPADPQKVSGSATFFNDDSGNGHVFLNGVATAAAGDVLSIEWDLIIDMPDPGPENVQSGNYVFYGNIFPPNADPIGLPEVFHELEIGSHLYTGSASFVVPIDATDMPFGFELQIYMLAPGTMTLTIPNNSIDLAVGPPVPEPGSACLLGVGLCCVAGLNRNRGG